MTMQFYSFRFGDMKVAQADPASAKTMAVEVNLGFRDPDQHTVESLNLTVHVLHDPDRSVSATEQEAYQAAQRLLGAAAVYCVSRTIQELCDETARNKAFVIDTR